MSRSVSTISLAKFDISTQVHMSTASFSDPDRRTRTGRAIREAIS
jgi:hypothetical protein